MEAKGPKEIAALLAKIYNKEFGGKKNGGYMIYREAFRAFIGRERVEDALVARIAEELLNNHQLVLIKTRAAFCIARESTVLTWPDVPTSVWTEVRRKPLPTSASSLLAGARGLG